MRRSAFIFAACIVLAMPTAEAGSTVTEEYVAGYMGDWETLCTDEPNNPIGQNIGGACFDVPPGSTSVMITVDDDLAEEQGWWYTRHFDDGSCSAPPLTPVTGCGFELFAGCEPAVIPIERRVVRIEIFLDGPLGPVFTCSTSTATSGTITAEFN